MLRSHSNKTESVACRSVELSAEAVTVPLHLKPVIVFGHVSSSVPIAFSCAGTKEWPEDTAPIPERGVENLIPLEPIRTSSEMPKPCPRCTNE